jgi:hypothetical protein
VLDTVLGQENGLCGTLPLWTLWGSIHLSERRAVSGSICRVSWVALSAYSLTDASRLVDRLLGNYTPAVRFGSASFQKRHISGNTGILTVLDTVSERLTIRSEQQHTSRVPGSCGLAIPSSGFL